MHHIWAAFRLQISILHGQTLESEGSFSDAVHRGLHFDRAPPNPLPSPTQTSQCEPKGSPHSAFNIIKKRLLQNTVSHATTQLSICFLRFYMRETLPLFRSTRHNVSKWTTRRYTPDVDRINSEKFPRWFFFFLSFKQEDPFNAGLFHRQILALRQWRTSVNPMMNASTLRCVVLMDAKESAPSLSCTRTTL